jgi:RNA polymerase sigma-70 factor (ECF subfamily)
MADQLPSLVRRLQSGDTSVFPEIYELTRKSVYFAALAILHDSAQAEDIMQDTYLKVLDRISTYQDQNFRAFLVRIARNEAINEYHRRQRTVAVDEEIDYMSDYSLEALVEIDAVKREVIGRALSSLDSLEKNIVIMHTIGDLPHREIALILDKPLGTITWIFAKAVRKMREAVKED